VAKNTVPRTTGDYGPLPSLSTASGALNARCQGARGVQDKNGNVFNFAGDINNLYKLSAGGWDAVSVSAGAYNTAADDAWEFAKFDQLVVAVNGHSDPIQVWTLGGATTFSNLTVSNSAPSARHVAAVEPGFIVVGNTTDANDGVVPNRIWWPAYLDPTDWPVPGTADAEGKQSDFRDLVNGGWVQRVTGAVGGATGAVFLEHAIYRMDYEGPPQVFGTYEIERARGTPSPNSVINLGPFAAYLGEDGFYIFNGQQSVPIGDAKIDKTFYADLDQDYYWRVWGAADPINNHFYWIYAGSGNTNGIPNKMLIYNWITRRWTEAEIDSEIIFSSFGEGYTLDTLDTLGFTLDTLPQSLDSRAWTGGRPQISAFNDSNQLAYFGGSNLAASIETGEFPESERVVYVDGLRVLVDGGTPTAQVGFRATPQETVSYTNATSAGDDGVCPQRIASRYVRALVNIPAGADWSHAQGIEPRWLKTGLR
jgi:hypothetical protein